VGKVYAQETVQKSVGRGPRYRGAEERKSLYKKERTAKASFKKIQQKPIDPIGEEEITEGPEVS